MDSRIIIIYVGIIFICLAHAQQIQYSFRFRNYTIESDTGSIQLICMNIFRNQGQHYIAGKVNVTKDIKVKSIHFQLYRCVYEKSSCEDFLKITVDKNIKEFIHMKNQFWSQVIESIKPRFDFPVLRKNVYESKGAIADAAGFVAFYPEAINYYYRIQMLVFDFDGKRAVTMWAEFEIHSFVKRHRNRNRGNSSLQG